MDQWSNLTPKQTLKHISVYSSKGSEVKQCCNNGHAAQYCSFNAKIQNKNKEAAQLMEEVWQ